jgi:CBS domain containing-hemolysin-like protein
MLVSASAEGGVVEPQEREMLHAIFDFGDLLVRQAMIRAPRSSQWKPTCPGRNHRLITESTPSSRSADDNLDQILGSLSACCTMQQPGWQKCTARSLCAIRLCPRDDICRRLAHHFRDNRQHIAIVLGQYGGWLVW